MDNKVCEFIWNMLDVSSNRPNGQCISYYVATKDPTSYDDVAYYRF
jgi:hypothetical protein